jgi:hypothetical protein
MTPSQWLYEAKVAKHAPNSAYIFKAGLLALFAIVMPIAQQWVNSIIRRYMLDDKAMLDKAIEHCISVLKNPDQRYWCMGGSGVGPDEISQCSPFDIGAFPADNEEEAHLLVTKLT